MRATPPSRWSGSLLVEGFRLMRERLPIYVALAGICGIAGWVVFPRIDMYAILASNPAALMTTPPVSVVLLLSLGALFFILPSALRRIEPSFKMTAVRAALTLATIFSVGLITEIGYAFAVIPGIVIAVLLSQTLINALLRADEADSLTHLGSTLFGSVRGSVAMTKTHFATTLGVVVASLFILLVPFLLVLLGLAILGVKLPPSLVVMAPLLFLTFIYFECVRYALIVRWYRYLSSEEPSPASP
jgi:hypothetical protein